MSNCQHSSVLVGTLHCHGRYPHEAEVLFAPLTCIELQSARTESSGIALQLVLSINLLAPTIEKVVAKLKTSHVDLLRLFISDFKAHGVPADVLASLRQCVAAAETRAGGWFNDAANFQSATASAFAARDAVLGWMLGQDLRPPWPRAFAALATAIDPSLAPRVRELAARDALAVGTRVLAQKEGYAFAQGVVTRVDGEKVDAKVSGFAEEVKGLPRTKALVVSDGGAGARRANFVNFGSFYAFNTFQSFQSSDGDRRSIRQQTPRHRQREMTGFIWTCPGPTGVSARAAVLCRMLSSR